MRRLSLLAPSECIEGRHRCGGSSDKAPASGVGKALTTRNVANSPRLPAFDLGNCKNALGHSQPIRCTASRGELDTKPCVADCFRLIAGPQRNATRQCLVDRSLDEQPAIDGGIKSVQRTLRPLQIIKPQISPYDLRLKYRSPQREPRALGKRQSLV